jgi:hypothetical protein
MVDTLYQRAKTIENIDAQVKKFTNNSNYVNVTEIQKYLFQIYEKNPVFQDALNKRQTIEESLIELSKINTGINKILPWRKDKVHNERLNQIGELISKPYHLEKAGILAPDNAITTAIGSAVLCFGSCYLLTKYFISQEVIDPIKLQQNIQFSQVFMPTIMTAFMTLAGVGFNYKRATGPLAIDEAQYVDAKILELYK